MSQAPPADQLALLDVQDVDIRIQQARHQRDKLPAVARLVVLEDERAELDSQRAALLGEVGDARRVVAKAEDDEASVRARAERDTARMNAGGMVSKELLAMQKELELLAARQSALEEEELEAMEVLETQEKALAATEENIRANEAAVEEAQRERDSEYARLDDEIAQLESTRAEAVAPLDADLVTLYDSLRTKNGGVGAAALVGGSCQGCHMSLTPADLAAIESAAPDDVVRCEECGRIVVRKL